MKTYGMHIVATTCSLLVALTVAWTSAMPISVAASPVVRGGIPDCNETEDRDCDGYPGCDKKRCKCKVRIYNASGNCQDVVYEDGLCKYYGFPCIPSPFGFLESYCDADRTLEDCSAPP